MLQVKLYASECGPKLIKRHTGAIERQFRLQCGKLPIGYRCSVCMKIRRLSVAAFQRALSTCTAWSLHLTGIGDQVA